MKKIFFYFLVLLTTKSFSQVSYKEIQSNILNTNRQLKIKLPQGYDEDSDKLYPLIVVLDGDYLFEPVAGQTDFQTYFDDMPSSIIVGIMQGKNRVYDGMSDDVSGLPVDGGLQFHKFVASELLPYLDYNYNTSGFRVLVGHNLMGNFINSYLFKENQAFQGFVNISPDFKGDMSLQLPGRLDYLNREGLFYYMSTSDKDIQSIRETILETHQAIEAIDDKKFSYYFDDFENDTHYTLVTSALSRAFEKIFDLYKPIRDEEIEYKAKEFKGTLDEYLIKKYEKIEQLFGVAKEPNEEDFEKLVNLAEEKNDLESIYKLGKLAKKQYPESILGTYYLALHSEKKGKTKKAVKLYENALELNETSHITKAFIMSHVEALTVVSEDNEDEIEEEEIDEEN